jgi:DNA gyrase/topoisomerase IV subunit B
LSNVKIEYYKGLGSWSKEEFQKLFEEKGFEFFLQDLVLDDKGKVYVNDWLSGKEIEKRKQYLRDFTLDIETL